MLDSVLTAKVLVDVGTQCHKYNIVGLESRVDSEQLFPPKNDIIEHVQSSSLLPLTSQLPVSKYQVLALWILIMLLRCFFHNRMVVPMLMDARLVVSSAHFWARAFFRLMGTVLQQRRCVRQVQQLVGLMWPRKWWKNPIRCRNMKNKLHRYAIYVIFKWFSKILQQNSLGTVCNILYRNVLYCLLLNTLDVYFVSQTYHSKDLSLFDVQPNKLEL